jgi:DNA-binding XRE family transcriptional regulator
LILAHRAKQITIDPSNPYRSRQAMITKKRKRGRPIKHELRQKAAECRQNGDSLAEIGKHLGVSQQRIHTILKMHGKKIIPRARLHCHGCDRFICKGDPRTWNRRAVWCVKCLESVPNAPFAVRLKTCRLARGLTQKELADLAGLNQRTIQYHEQYIANPKWVVLVKLVKVLGCGLVCG